MLQPAVLKREGEESIIFFQYPCWRGRNIFPFFQKGGEGGSLKANKEFSEKWKACQG